MNNATMIESTTADYARYLLATGDGRCQLELLPEHGGITNQLWFTGKSGELKPVLAGLSSLLEIENDARFSNIPLFPFANRLRDGRYHWQGQDYQFAVNESARNNALHGFIQHLTPKLGKLEQSESSAKVQLDYDYDGSIAGYPFPALVSIGYLLESTGTLAVDLTVTNRHSESIPVGGGWHPYFNLGAQVDNLLLKLPRVERVEVDERMLPTGTVCLYDKFETLSPIADTQFDTCFHLADEGINVSTAKVIICATGSEEGLEIWQETGVGKYNFIQICVPPDRQSIAIEPVSCGIDAFNTKHGLVTLAPGQRWSTKCGVRLIGQ